ncbi:hypothetical protein Hanom_Chr07g00677761 [Helianthus anomalus]
MGYGVGLGHELGTNAQVTTSGGFGFGVAPWAGVSARALGRPSGLLWPALFGWGWLGYRWLGFFFVYFYNN